MVSKDKTLETRISEISLKYAGDPGKWKTEEPFNKVLKHLDKLDVLRPFDELTLKSILDSFPPSLN